MDLAGVGVIQAHCSLHGPFPYNGACSVCGTTRRWEEWVGSGRDMSTKATKLRNAVDGLSRHLAEGGAMPDGEPMSCNNCPVAIYLSEKVGEPIGTNGMKAWYVGADSHIRIGLPGNVVRWIHDFDEGSL